MTSSAFALPAASAAADIATSQNAARGASRRDRKTGNQDASSGAHAGSGGEVSKTRLAGYIIDLDECDPSAVGDPSHNRGVGARAQGHCRRCIATVCCEREGAHMVERIGTTYGRCRPIVVFPDNTIPRVKLDTGIREGSADSETCEGRPHRADQNSLRRARTDRESHESRIGGGAHLCARREVGHSLVELGGSSRVRGGEA